uniref:Transmembrane protein 260 n=1 Tax=Eptatretus burgeri TaxID=7764 RepID=A0A8C4WQC3_EPTBU
MLNATLAAAAAAILYAAVHRATGSPTAAIYGAGVFAFSRLTWQWAVSTDVFSLNNLFGSLLLLLSVCFEQAAEIQIRVKLAWLVAFCSGLSLCNQHTMVLGLACQAPWLLYQLYRRKELSWRIMVQLSAFLAFGLLPYMYLPLSSWSGQARWSWGDASSVRGLLMHVLRQEYGTFSLAKAGSGSGMLTLLRAQLYHACGELQGIGLILALIVGLSLLPQRRSGQRASELPLLLLLMILLYSLFFAWRANLDISNPLFLGVVERFWLQPLLLLSAMAGIGLSALHIQLSSWLGRPGLLKTVKWLLVATCILWQLKDNYKSCNKSQDTVVEEFGTNVLLSLPKAALVLTRGDLPGNALRYLHYCRGLRPDVTLVDQEMMTYTWYLPSLQHHLHGVHFPGSRWHPAEGRLLDGSVTFSLRTFLDQNVGHRPILACIGLNEGDMSWRGVYERRPWGVCERLLPAGTPFHPESWIEVSQELYNWSYPHQGFEQTSWEAVANEEMWQARMKNAFFLYELAEDQRQPLVTRRHLYKLSYQLYWRIISTGEVHPPNWHKNYALVCQKRLHEPGLSLTESALLLTDAIAHFTHYAEKEPMDHDMPMIRLTIQHLRQELHKLHSVQAQNAELLGPSV